MGLVNAQLVALLAEEGLVAEDTAWSERDVLGEWLALQGIAVEACADILTQYFTLPYLHLEPTARLQSTALQCLDWPLYQRLDDGCFVCVRPPNAMERSAYENALGGAPLFLSDAVRVHSVLLREHPVPQAQEPDMWSRQYTTEAFLQAEQGHVNRLIGRILTDAIDAKATDVHFYKVGVCFRVVFRLDGNLETYAEIDPSEAEGLINKLKLLAKMDVAEHRLPQDGHIQLSCKGAVYNLRLGTLPLRDGERIALRILPAAQRRETLRSLGFTAQDASWLESILTTGDRGLVLITGPTNSGKTTTLYACLKQLSAQTQMVYTIEDPVEAVLPDVQQMQVNEQSGFSFAKGLRGILRSDPDVIAVGELRDAETVAIAARAALSGQLVLATLHAKNAQETVDRLRDLGLSDLLLGAVLQAVVNQRLVPQRCRACDGKGEREGVVCVRCGGSGREGRTVLAELWVVCDEERTCIALGESGQALRKQALERGFRTLAQDAEEEGLPFYEGADAR